MPSSEPPKKLTDVDMNDLLAAASLAPDAASAELLDDLVDFARRVRATWPDVAPSAPDVVRSRVAAHLEACVLRDE